MAKVKKKAVEKKPAGDQSAAIAELVNAVTRLRLAIERPDSKVRVKALLVPVDEVERFDIAMLTLGINVQAREFKAKF